MTLSQKIETKTSVIWIDDEGILRLKIKPNSELYLDDVKECFLIYEQLGCKENKVLQLMDAKVYFYMDDDAQKYAAEVGKDFFIASAIVNNSIAIRLLVNFFNTFYQHGVPFKLFGDEEKALRWLRKFRND